MRILLIISVAFSIAYSQRSEYAYTSPARTLRGDLCLGDCLQDECIVNRDGDKEPCEALNTAPVTYYTARLRYPANKTCLSNCGNFNNDNPNSWCYVNDALDWDYCNPNREPTANTRETLPKSYPMTIAYPENEIPSNCITKCAYRNSTAQRMCKTSRETFKPCAPFATSALPHLTRPFDYAAQPNSTYEMCVYEIDFGEGNCSRDDDDSDEEDACPAPTNPDDSNTYITSNVERGISSLPEGTVDDDAATFEDRGHTVNLEPDVSEPNSITSYTSVYVAGLEFSLPTVVKATITKDIIESVQRPRFGDIEELVPQLTNALRLVQDYEIVHLIGRQNGGPDAAYNLVPQTRRLNRGVWRQMENDINRFARNNLDGWVDMVIVVYYDSDDTILPIAFGVNLAFYYAYGDLASECQDLLYWNQTP